MNTVAKPLTRDVTLLLLDAAIRECPTVAGKAVFINIRAAVEAMYEELDEAKTLLAGVSEVQRNALSEVAKLRAELDAARRDAERLRKSIETAKIVMQCARDLSEEIHERGSHELHGRLFSAFCKYDSLFEDRQGPQP